MNYRNNNNAGRMNKRATFLSPPGTITNGWPSEEWTKHVTVWAELKTAKGYRLFSSDATQWQGKCVIGIRYRKDITENMRVEVAGKTYEMDSPPVNDNGDNQWLTIFLKEVV